jgi:hypothetical protein
VVQTRELNFNYNRTLKMIFKGAATTVIAHAASNPFREAYDRLCGQGARPNLTSLSMDEGLDGPGLRRPRSGASLWASR